MGHILDVVASPRAEQSQSRLLTEAFLDAFRERHPEHTVDTLDLWADPLPTFDGASVAAKMTVIAGGTPDGESRAAWDSVQRIFDRFDAADTYVFGVPMWNSGIPWILKHLIDTISQPGLLFAFDPEHGYRGLLRGKRAVVAYTSAVYASGVAPAFGRDFHSSYFDDWLRFAGIDDVHTVRLQPTFPGSPDLRERTATAVAQARALAEVLAPGASRSDMAART